MTSLYDISIPVCQKVLTVTASLLKAGESWGAENSVSSAELLKLRIYEDMLPLSVQVLIIVMTSRKCIERLTGTAPPEITDALSREWTSAELQELVAAAQGELAAVDRAVVDAKPADAQVPCKFGPQMFQCRSPADYIHGYVEPTVYFHLNMIYAVLRGKGVPIGKSDYMGEFMKDFIKE
jgi:hypothetical protein